MIILRHCGVLWNALLASPFRRAASSLSSPEISLNFGFGMSIEDGGVSIGESGAEEDEAESVIFAR